LRFARDFDLAAVPIGAIVWKTDDPVLRHRLEQSYAGDEPFHRAPLSVHIRGSIGEALQASVTADGRSVTVTWPGPLERARKHPLSAEQLREQVGRLGDTPYYLAEVELDVCDPVLVPKSVLNTLRRQAVSELLALR